MRKLWLNVVTLSAAFSFGACAAGTQTEVAPSASTVESNDAGSGTQQTTGSEDSGSTVIDPPGTGGDDAGQQTTPGAGDSGGTTPGSGVDSAAPPQSEDSGSPPVVSDDAGAPAVPTTCPSTSTYDNEWLNVSASAPVCATSADCSAGQCCYVPSALLQLLGGTAACVAF